MNIYVPQPIHSHMSFVPHQNKKAPLSGVTVVVTNSPPFFYAARLFSHSKAGFKVLHLMKATLKRDQGQRCVCVCVKRDAWKRKTEKRRTKGCTVLFAQQKMCWKQGNGAESEGFSVWMGEVLLWPRGAVCETDGLCVCYTSSNCALEQLYI